MTGAHDRAWPATAGLPSRLASFGPALNVAVVGATGGIGGALADALARDSGVARLFRLARGPAVADDWLSLDLRDESSIAAAAAAIGRAVPELHLAIVATGVLHDGDGLQPEKSWRGLSPAALETAFQVNAIGPALVAKHLLPLLARTRRSGFAALSARVGSIADNDLGGWHAYRASKAALNMLIRTLAIELARRNPLALCVGLHPGTVDTALSRPFQRGLPDGQLMPPQCAAHNLLDVIDGLTVEDSGGLYAWDGRRIPY